MLETVVFTSATLCLCVCHKAVVNQNGRTHLASFWHVCFLHLFYGVRKFGYLQWSSKCDINLAGERRTLRAWQTGPLSVNLVDNTSEPRCLTTAVYHSDHQALSTERFHRAGSLATADLAFETMIKSIRAHTHVEREPEQKEFQIWSCRQWVKGE